MNLLPCPFCGEQPNSADDGEVAYIGCENEKCMITPGISTTDWYEHSFDDLAKVWNERPAPIGQVQERPYLPILPAQYFGLARHYPLNQQAEVPCTGCKYDNGVCGHPDSGTNEFWGEGKTASGCFTAN